MREVFYEDWKARQRSMIRVSELKLPVTGNQKALKKAGSCTARACGGNQGVPHFQAFSGCQKKDNIHYAYVVDAEVKNENKILEKNKDKHISKNTRFGVSSAKGGKSPDKASVVVGFSSMRACLLPCFLAEMGLQPIVLGAWR